MQTKSPVLRLLILPVVLCLVLAGCAKEKFFKVEDSEWRILVIWDAGPHVGWDVHFKTGGDLSMVDDTASYTGSWTRQEQVVTWVVEIPDRQVVAKGTLDRRKIEGTLTDETGYEAIYTGDRQ